MTHRRITRLVVVALAALLAVRPAGAQRTGPLLPATYADTLLEAGRWAEAEDAFYAQSRIDPRAPGARAALGRYLAMKGAILPGTILIEEAQKFGLDPLVARALLAPWRVVQRSRGALRLPVDSAITVEPSAEGLFRLSLPGRPARRVDVVPRIMGTDSASARARIGTDAIERFVPSYDVALHQVTLHDDPRSALRALGRRYPVLRHETNIRVLVAPGRALSLMDAMHAVGARWWQLDLAHGIVVVR